MPLGSSINNNNNNKQFKQNPALLQRDRLRNALIATSTTTKNDPKNNQEQPSPPEKSLGDVTHRRVSYGMASVDLASKWYELVQNEQVAVTTTVPVKDNDNDQMVGVRYGVRLHPFLSNCFMEFVEPAFSENGEDNDAAATAKIHPKIAAMNATLQEAIRQQEVSEGGSTTASSSPSSSSTSLFYRHDGDFVAQLQLVRTLRPPPSPGFESSSSNDFRTFSTPPPYDRTTDSFVTGPLRLQLRPLVACLSLPCFHTAWDVYHNISPADVRGHFLLVPTLHEHANNNNYRGQALIETDCHDLVRLTASIRPFGSLMVGFNSVGAGASQNHIHCHLWPSPPVPLLVRPTKSEESTNAVEQEGQVEEMEDVDEHDHNHAHDMNDDDDTTVHGWSCYAASRVSSFIDFVDIRASGTNNDNDQDDDEEEDDAETLVEVSYLDYPCFCVQLSTGSTTTPAKTVESLHALGKALWTVLTCLGNAPHNVCMLNRPAEDDDSNDSNDASNKNNKHDGCVNVDVYVFVRSRERSPTIVPASKAGASEMMGVFHCHNRQQVDELVAPTVGRGKLPPMAQVLQDVSYENPEELWETIKAELSSLIVP